MIGPPPTLDADVLADGLGLDLLDVLAGVDVDGLASIDSRCTRV